MKYWRLHGDAVAMTTYLGLHTLPSQRHGSVSICLEIKTRLFAVMFNIDKVVATFTGRPPLLSRRYCSTPLPLDISDEALLKGAESVRRTLKPFEGGVRAEFLQIHPTTLLRVRVQMAYIRDEVLEIALSHQPVNDKGIIRYSKKP